MNAQLTEELIRGVVHEVLASMGKSRPAVSASSPSSKGSGAFSNVDDAVAAATAAQKEFARRGLDCRKKAVACIRRICTEQAESLGREELDETKIGRIEHKIEKLIVCAERVPGV